MITTQFGNEVKVLAVSRDKEGNVSILTCERQIDGKQRDYPPHMLRADRGWEEIREAIAEAEKSPLT